MDELSKLEQTLIHFYQELKECLEEELFPNNDSECLAVAISDALEDLAEELEIQLSQEGEF